MGEYRLVRQGGGRTGFAHVRVRLVERERAELPAAEWAVDPSDHTSAQPEHDDAEVQAALAGAADALASVAQLGIDTHHRVVQVTWAGINIVDTEPTAMRAAACAATVDALGVMDRFEVVHDGEGWRCRLRES